MTICSSQLLPSVITHVVSVPLYDTYSILIIALMSLAVYYPWVIPIHTQLACTHHIFVTGGLNSDLLFCSHYLHKSIQMGFSWTIWISFLAVSIPETEYIWIFWYSPCQIIFYKIRWNNTRFSIHFNQWAHMKAVFPPTQRRGTVWFSHPTMRCREKTSTIHGLLSGVYVCDLLHEMMWPCQQ